MNPAGHGERAEVADVLDERGRRALVHRAECRIYGRLGWRLMRPLIATGLLAAPLALWQSALPPAPALLLFLAGALSFYVVLQVYVHFWTRAAERAKAALEREGT